MKRYKVLQKQIYSDNTYSLVPIRFEDRMVIMKWRNEQISHLRQSKPLTEEDQNNYFKNVVAKLFDQEQPDQILFSFLKKGECIGYGGLVYINWVDKNAEISFIMDSELERSNFDMIWSIYLSLIDEVAFYELKLHKVSTYAYDIRPNVYKLFEIANYKKEAVLIDHKFFDDQFVNVVIHAKINPYE